MLPAWACCRTEILGIATSNPILYIYIYTYNYIYHAASVSKRSSRKTSNWHCSSWMVPWSIEQPTGPTTSQEMLPFYLSCYFLFFPRSELLSWLWCLIHLGHDFAAGSQECGPRFWLERCSGASQSNCVYVLNVGEPYIESIDTLIVDFLHKIDDYFWFPTKIKWFPFFFGGVFKMEISNVFF